MKKRTQLLLKHVRERFFNQKKQKGASADLFNLMKMNKSILTSTAATECEL